MSVDATSFVRDQMLDSRPAPVRTSGIGLWVRKNLFATPGDVIMTVLAAAFLLWLVPVLVFWVVTVVLPLKFRAGVTVSAASKALRLALASVRVTEVPVVPPKVTVASPATPLTVTVRLALLASLTETPDGVRGEAR